MLLIASLTRHVPRKMCHLATMELTLQVFSHTAKPLLDGVLDGFNATVFAYGATGCGKTHTIRFISPKAKFNCSGTPENPGLIYLTTQELFERCAALTDKKVEVSLSFLEIYNETIKDLLVDGDSKPLQLREDANHKISVPGLTTANPVTVCLPPFFVAYSSRLTRS